MINRIILALIICALLPMAHAAPDIQHWETETGLKVYFVASPELPMVDVRLVFDAGSARDGEKAGVARLTNALLDSGAGSWNADEIADRFESVGAQFGGGSLRDMAWVSLRSVKDPNWFEPAVETFLKVLHEPTFPAKDFSRTKKQTFIALRDQAQDPGEVASKAFYKAIYGDHPYASPTIGTEDSVKAIKRKDLVAFYKRYYVARNGVLAMVGDLSREEAEALSARIDAGLARGEAAPALPPVSELSEGRTLRIPFPSEQAHVIIGQPGMRRGDDDYFALYVGNHVLGGGGFTSRLFKEVREQRGLSYSVYSYFLPMGAKGPFLLGLQTRLDQAGEAEAVAKQAITEFVAKGPSSEELTASQKNITGGFPLRTASNGNIVEYLAVIGFYDLPLDYLDTFTGKVSALDKAEIRDAFQRRLHPDKLITVIVGGEATPG